MEQNRVYVTFIFIGDSGDGKPSSQFQSCPSLNCVKQIQYFPTKGYPVKTAWGNTLFLAGVCDCFPRVQSGACHGHADLVTNVSYLHLALSLSGPQADIVSARVTDMVWSLLMLRQCIIKTRSVKTKCLFKLYNLKIYILKNKCLLVGYKMHFVTFSDYISLLKNILANFSTKMFLWRI